MSEAPVSFYRRYGYWILLVTVFLMPGVFGGALRSLRTNKNEVKEWLPANYQETADFDWFLKHFHGGQFVLISWDGCTLDNSQLKLFASKLLPPLEKRRENPEGSFFARVITGPDVLKQLMDPPNNLPREEALERLRGALIGADNATTCALITFTSAGEKNPRATLQRIVDVATQECAIPLEAIHMGGPPVDNVSLDKAGEESLMRLAALTGAFGLLISWWCLRSFHLIVVVFFTAIYSAAASLAVVWYSGGQMNSILLTMPSLVYVAAMSGAIHLSNYYRDEVHERGLEGAAGRALVSARLPLILATITTAVGLWSVAYTNLVPIQFFGIYSGIGVVISMIVLFLFLPAALEMFPLAQRSPAAGGEGSGLADFIFSSRWNVVGETILRHNLFVAGACLAVMVACGWGLQYTRTSVKLLNFFQRDSKIVQDYTWLEEHLGPLVPMEVVLRFDKQKCQLSMVDRLELVRRIESVLRQSPEVGSVLSAATFAPKPKTPPKFGGLGRVLVRDTDRLQKNVYNKQLEKHRAELIHNDYLSEDSNEEVWRVSARVGALPDLDYAAVIQGFRERVEPVLAQQRTAGAEGIDATYTGLVPLVDKAQRELFSGLINGFIQDLILISLVMMLAVRDLGAGLLLLIPSVFPAVIVFGMMGWLGITVDVGTVMPPCVALGVTVDDVVHFLLWFRRGLEQGMNRRQAVMLAYKDCARPMYQSWGVIGLGLSVFSLSPFTPTQRFGMLMLTLLTAALIGNLLLLPALLAGPLGWLFQPLLQRRMRRRGALPNEPVPAAPSATAGQPATAGPVAAMAIDKVVLPHGRDLAETRSGGDRHRPDAPHRSLRGS